MVKTCVVVTVYAVQKSCFGVSVVLVGNKQFTMSSQPVET
jgi:hypothetical protein